MKRGFLQSRLLTVLFWLAMSALTLLPVWWMFLVSVRSRADLFGKPSFLLDVSAMTWDNYAAVLANPTFQKYMTNSLIVATSNAVLVSVLALLAAYAMSRFALAGKDNLFFWVLTNRMAPPAVFLLPLFLMFTGIKLGIGASLTRASG
ncbi:hypothetical protein ACFSHQ_02000 [Gemmobacter lanyuensis]